MDSRSVSTLQFSVCNLRKHIKMSLDSIILISWMLNHQELNGL